MEDNFTFSKQHAYRFIKVFETFGSNTSVTTLGIKKLYLLTFVPEEELEEFIEEVKPANKSFKELEAEVKTRIKPKISYKTDNPEEEEHFKWIRDGENLIIRFQDFFKLKRMLEEDLVIWMKNSRNYNSESDKHLVNKIHNLKKS